jgi:UDP-N-acetylglucosamine pyrophosphorylase
MAALNACFEMLFLLHHSHIFAAIERVVREDTLNMEIIVNNKTLNNGLNVVQLETAVGAAMKTFEGGLGEMLLQT